MTENIFFVVIFIVFFMFFFFGIHNIDNSFNMMVYKEELLRLGYDYDIEDCNLVGCFGIEKLYMISVVMVIVSFIIFAFMALLYLIKSGMYD